MLKNSYLVWEGASLLDNSPIALIITGVAQPTSNRKTGRMIQSWIIQQEHLPTIAGKKDLDKGICGNCPLKLSNTGSCYVNLLPINNIYHKYKRKEYPKLTSEDLAIIKRKRKLLRLGSYGEPTALSLASWLPLINACKNHTGYTHQWRNCDQEWRNYIMASVETINQAKQAQAEGWRTFRIITPNSELASNEIICPNTQSDYIQCEDCLLCNGGKNKPNIADPIHGLQWKVNKFLQSNYD